MKIRDAINEAVESRDVDRIVRLYRFMRNSMGMNYAQIFDMFDHHSFLVLTQDSFMELIGDIDVDNAERAER